MSKAPPKQPVSAANTLRLEVAPAHTGHRIVIYGPGGVGKTSQADLAPGPVVSFDLDDSLGVLQPANTKRVAGIEGWDDLRKALNGPGWNDIRTIVIDSGTKAEELALAWVIGNIPHEKGAGKTIKRIEDYGYGKGYQHLYDTFLVLLNDLDQHARAGRHVIIVCHDCTASVPNPSGEDWIRYEPRLQSPSSGKASIRLRVREWADHVFFLGLDVVVKDGKAAGRGTRTLWPVEMPHCMAKSRTLADAMPIELGKTTLWDALLGKDK